MAERGWLTVDLCANSGAFGAVRLSGSGRENWCGLGWSDLALRRHGPVAVLCKGTVGWRSGRSVVSVGAVWADGDRM